MLLLVLFRRVASRCRPPFAVIDIDVIMAVARCGLAWPPPPRAVAARQLAFTRVEIEPLDKDHRTINARAYPYFGVAAQCSPAPPHYSARSNEGLESGLRSIYAAAQAQLAKPSPEAPRPRPPPPPAIPPLFPLLFIQISVSATRPRGPAGPARRGSAPLAPLRRLRLRLHRTHSLGIFISVGLGRPAALGHA